jgi:hypothetical protein
MIAFLRLCHERRNPVAECSGTGNGKEDISYKAVEVFSTAEPENAQSG